MKRILLIALMVFSGFACSANESVMFFQTSSQGSIEKRNDNHYVLKIESASKYVNYFSDRPDRKSGIISLTQFNSFWTDGTIKNSFKTNPPNAAIIMVDAQGKRQDFVAIVTNPIFSKGQLAYDLQPLNKQNLQSGSFKHLVMFIDEIHWNPGGF